MQEIFENILIVAGRLKKMNEKRYPEFLGSEAFKSDFMTLLDLIEKWKQQNKKTIEISNALKN